MTAYDAIVIGGGHNGLAAAAFLARAGWRTRVLERDARVDRARSPDAEILGIQVRTLPREIRGGAEE